MKATERLFKILGVIVSLALIFALLPLNSVEAADPSLKIMPEHSTGMLCSDTIVSVWVYGVNDLYGYDIYVKWDHPEAIEVLEVTNGDFLDEGVYPIPTVINNTTGMLHTSMSQRNPQTPKSGDGELIQIRIRSIVPDVTVTFDIITEEESQEVFWTELTAFGGVEVGFTPTNGDLTTTDECPFTTEISISPARSFACTSSFGFPPVYKYYTFDVMVNYAVDLWAYDLKVSFDQTVLAVTEVKNGGFLEVGPGAVFTFNNTNGSIVGINTQQTPSEPKTGSGKLLTITFLAGVSDKIVNLDIKDTSILQIFIDPPDGPPYTLPITKNIADGVVYTSSCIPNAVDLKSFDVLRKSRKAILTWETASEIDIQGFNIYRSGKKDGTLKKMNTEIIPADAVGTTDGAQYQFINYSLKPWKTYFYWLESVGMSEEETTLHGPYKAAPPR